MRLRPFRRSTLLKWCTWRWCDAAQLLSFLEEVERRSRARSMHGRWGTGVCDRRSSPLTPGHSPLLERGEPLIHDCVHFQRWRIP